MQTARGEGRGQRPRQVDAVLLESSVRPWHLPSSTLAPTEPHPARCGNPLGSRGGDAPHALGSGRCGVSLQLKSKWDESIFTKGCIQALEGWLPRNIYIVAGVFIAISLLQVRSPCPLWFPLSLRVAPVHLNQMACGKTGGRENGEEEGRQELCESEKPGVLRGAQGLGGEAGSPQAASGTAAAAVRKVRRSPPTRCSEEGS